MSEPITPSQTVGPFFGVGLPYEGSEDAVPADGPGAIRVEGQVTDGKGDPVPDALLEVWEPTVGFGRCRTDSEGAFHFVVARPQKGAERNGVAEAPHLNVTVFARGLLRHLVTRIYFPDEPANDRDPVLQLVDGPRRQTLIARRTGAVLHFDIRLQGDDETVFFAI
jgi:protocatechuate 3,4-dioxygenase, alpha subunit